MPAETEIEATMHNKSTPPDTALRPVPASGLARWATEHGAVPLAWAATTPTNPYPNLGDALSALMVSVVAGLPVSRKGFDANVERLVAVGTIAQNQKNGHVHLWGTGLDAERNAFDPALGHFALPPETAFTVHAMRGRRGAEVLRRCGLTVPDAYGDPVSFLPRIMGQRPVVQTHELGVVLHITELTDVTPAALPLPSLIRYSIPPELAGAVRIIHTKTDNTTEAMLACVDAMRSCKRIASTSFHGLVIAESFGIPNVWFSTEPGGGAMLEVDDMRTRIDHRVRDWYSGMAVQRIAAYRGQRNLPTDWAALIDFIDRFWSPVPFDGRPLFDAFPLPPAVSFEDPHWPLDPLVFDALRY